MRYAVGIDVGGTHLRVALVDEKGTLLKKEMKVVAGSRDPLPFFDQVKVLIKKVAGDHLKKLSGIGLGLPGICNQKEGLIHQLPHFPTWRDVAVAEIFRESFACPVVFDNDANMAALGEKWLGAAKSFSSFIMLTLGTGIGGGLFLNNKLWQGEEGFAGEVGHMVIEMNGRLCACGKRGCWEMYASSGAVPNGTTAKDLANQASKKEPAALKFWEEFGSYLGLGIINLANITGVKHFVIGGGIANAIPFFLESTKKTIQKGSYARMAIHTVVVPSQLEGNAALLGSVSTFFL
ncbi:MAG: hypothetical protein A2W61_03380 [Deltaproteobacteria bacterium RIFCSPLOWO2_01_44_7]|nr:MAG: hypothetical protein A2712_03795 [Deltaproteobacteria bacterium RIFCSPHIGHO2_01_FULL_43_49]OGQ16310.1 MAG: hypothetical protein A3D22_01765 [Deltaproteobacteria bacterium RIFCSPHIGHO2_02_FULL_44_53]OGQ29270.1 MAG: hypothetical protein A3D98_05550 [Deltaproteobacteria bacterium RIFCSPHIGHO2_12_FULL_44_21]OGQ32827.1 MAG: hypothetical protein A2979_09695 [Deltaproteobacteria bacterium RIFCSPLOWO2_01_FULL_45_74]OGQ38158.1 MAG: hypothetical protein A2W61_03380 [Deltaproteobacteria bacterium 